jgi:hypothetical protein
MRLSRLVVFLSPLLLGGCATVLTGTRQDIQVDSQPAGAVCTFTRAGEKLGSVTTPGSLNIQRNAAPVTVVCTRDDYEEARAVLNARREMATVGNAIPGGFIGGHIDGGSGAANRYDSFLRVELVPMTAADRAAATTARAAAAAAAAAQPAAPTAPAAPAPPSFQTGTWAARNVVIADRSAATCSRDAGLYTFNLKDDTLTVHNINGRMLSVTVSADGRIEEPFRSPSGARLVLVGNARTRELEIVNSAGSCRWKLTPAT